MGLGVVGLDFQGLAVMGDGLVDLSAAGQSQAEVVVGHPTIGIPVDRRPIERLDVGIHPALPPTQHGQHGQQQPGSPSVPSSSPNPPHASAATPRLPRTT